MDKEAFQACFQINKRDNVATALSDIEPGTARLVGDYSIQEIIVREKIKKGHKIAIAGIDEGENIIKYGVVIGKAKKQVSAGEWVHLHNCKSLYDKRSDKLDIQTGAPHDTRYE